MLKKKLVRTLTSLFIISSIFAMPIYAQPAEEKAGAQEAYIVEELVDHLHLHARYENVDRASLYRAGLLSVLEEHPELYDEILKSVLESIDENSEYYTPEEAELLNEQITGTIVGIGITFQMCPDGMDVRSVIPDTPAANAGVQVGDVIVSADDILLSGVNSDTAASYVRGEEGTKVRVGIKRKGVDKIIYLDMVREKIIGTSVSSQIYSDTNDSLMYIRVYGFVSNTAECFMEALDEAEQKGISNLIIDVRDNGGGIFSQAIAMADLLVPKGSIITTEDHKIEFFNHIYKATLDDTAKFNTVVLINENSASASEVLAAALSENDCATLIGTKSYGKGTIQTVMGLPYGDTVKYTIGYYLTPKGNNIHKIGLAPDEVVENTTSSFDISKYPPFKYEQVYKLGDKGPEIKTAKELLLAWGSYEGEINEIYDEELVNAVFVFQGSTELYPYGVLDLTTQRELYTRLEKSKVLNDDQLDAAFSHFGMTRTAE